MIVHMATYRATCSVAGCSSPAYTHASGLCVMHYARMKKHGSTDDPRAARFGQKRDHPLWMRWAQFKRRDMLCAEWTDFWAFVDGVSPQPPNTKKLARIRDDEPYGSTNFRWLQTPTRDESLAYMRQWQKDNRDRVKDSRFRREYGIGWDDYQQMLAEQKGVCAICHRNESRFVRRKTKELRFLCVDHDHTTGAVRGLLCGDCNVALGAMDDDPGRLFSAIQYLGRWGKVAKVS